MPFRPLSSRAKPDPALDSLHEGVPSWLAPSLTAGPRDDRQPVGRALPSRHGPAVRRRRDGTNRPFHERSRRGCPAGNRACRVFPTRAGSHRIVTSACSGNGRHEPRRARCRSIGASNLAPNGETWTPTVVRGLRAQRCAPYTKSGIAKDPRAPAMRGFPALEIPCLRSAATGRIEPCNCQLRRGVGDVGVLRPRPRKGVLRRCERQIPRLHGKRALRCVNGR